MRINKKQILLMDLLNKFSQVSLSAMEKLNHTDKGTVIFYEKCYLAMHTHLNSVLTQLTNVQTFCKTAEVFARNSDQNPHRYGGYDLDKAFREINEKIAALPEEFTHAVFAYFEKTYNLIIPKQKSGRWESKNKYDSLLLTPTAETIMVYIFAELKTSNFSDVGKKTMIENCHKTLYKGCEIKNKTVSLKDYIQITTEWNGTLKVGDWSSTRLNDLFKYISLFEFEALENNTGFSVDRWNFTPEINSDYELPKCEKVKAIRLFKNGKVNIIFASAEQALAFWNYFDLGNI